MALPGAVAPSRAPLTLVFSSVESHHRSRVYEQRRRESLVLLDKTEKKRNETEELLQSIDARLQELDQESKELKAYQVRRSPPPPPCRSCVAARVCCACARDPHLTRHRLCCCLTLALGNGRRAPLRLQRPADHGRQVERRQAG